MSNPHRVPADFLGTLRVHPRLPSELQGLEDLADNIWWAWNPGVRRLFQLIHKETWMACEGNPRRFMNNVSQKDLDAAAKNPEVRKLYDHLMKFFGDYMSGKGTWWTRNHGEKKNALVAYFSAEFGLHESLPIYSGGLGVLAGDHCKSASDLGIPFVAMGLLYREGYFIQNVDSEGQQRDSYKRLDWRDLPIRPAVDAHGESVYISVDFPGRQLWARVWTVQVGRNPLYLLDTDIERNSPPDRLVTARLYGGDQEMRVQQEILLGVGGVRALRALGKEPTVFHMNEGHSVFLALERLREFVHDHGLSFSEAREMVRATTLFTTHTPVPAGNDAFPFALIGKYFRSFWESLAISQQQFLSMALETRQDGAQLYSLTVLALSLSAMANGVSELHGDTSRRMWQPVWPDVPVPEVPIDHITNGVHSRTWMSIDMQELFDKYMPKDWREHIDDQEMWNRTDGIPDAELWGVIGKLRMDMIDFVHRRLTTQHTRFGESPVSLRQWGAVLDKDVLTIGFARRFATYKRATLIFRDPERLHRILSNADRPVQLLFAGKAHPHDMPGQDFIRQIVRLSKDDRFRGRVVFLENYDMNVGRRLTSGVDVWLNNPRKPLEASGTSGMKVPLNGGINCSILDGWWCEAYKSNPLSGFALQSEVHYDNTELQDAAEAEAIYEMLEEVIVPMFYDRDAKGIPTNWVKRVRESMKTCAPMFSTDRMVEEYSEKFYIPGSVRSVLMSANGYDRARKTARWKEELRNAWPSVRVGAHVSTNGSHVHKVLVGDRLELVAEVDLGMIDPANVDVQIYAAPLHGPQQEILPRAGLVAMRPDGKTAAGLHIYKGSLAEGESGEYGYSVRVVPKHPDLVHANELGLMAWAHR